MGWSEIPCTKNSEDHWIDLSETSNVKQKASNIRGVALIKETLIKMAISLLPDIID